MTLSELAGWLALVVGTLALVRVIALRRGPLLTHPLVKEIEILQKQQAAHHKTMTRLKLDNEHLVGRINAQEIEMHEMRQDITLLRRQITDLGHTPAYGRKFETGPISPAEG